MATPRRVQSRGSQIDTDYRDPHLFPGQIVDVAESGLPDDITRRVKARFWCAVGGGSEMCWVVLYFKVPFPHLAPLHSVTVSQRNDPPPMPKWAVGAETTP